MLMNEHLVDCLIRGVSQSYTVSGLMLCGVGEVERDGRDISRGYPAALQRPGGPKIRCIREAESESHTAWIREITYTCRYNTSSSQCAMMEDTSIIPTDFIVKKIEYLRAIASVRHAVCTHFGLMLLLYPKDGDEVEGTDRDTGRGSRRHPLKGRHRDVEICIESWVGSVRHSGGSMRKLDPVVDEICEGWRRASGGDGMLN
ncbi:hypothetical protein BD779DRAFT_1526587 [Infundibulicybe gibba]|nr:hypothetical protein BD779DRAFT_1526587 [Infundibulicybe gibba]